jgi:alpha-D-ribose 1-methylphosphonate 5-triphosphate synthase subunit PhnH
MPSQTLEGGFTEPAVQSATAFRSVMEAMARPGTCHTITGATPPSPLSKAAGAVLLTLCDTNTPLYLAGPTDTPEVRAWIAFHTGAPLVGPTVCAFAIGSWADLMPLDPYPIGTPDYPDRSATLIVETDTLPSEKAALIGPGIKDKAYLSLPDLAPIQINHRLFPLGLDFIFTSEATVTALPRSTQVS